MQLSKHMKEYLVSELRTASDLMQKSAGSPVKQVYFFSAGYGAVLRVLNIEFDPKLVYLHHILNSLYAVFDGRLLAMQQGREMAVVMPENVFDNVGRLTGQLADRITNDQDYADILEAMVVLAYVTTGNGSYLYQTGRLTPPQG